MKYQPTPDSPGSISFKPKQIGSIAEQLEQQNQRDRRDMEVVKATMDQNSETAKRNAKNQEFNNRMKDKEFQKLMTFSKSLMEYGVEEQNKKNKAEMEEGIAMAYTDGISEEQSQGLEDFEAQLASDDQETQAAGGLVFDQTNNYEVSSRVKNLSGWRQYGYQQGMAQRAGTEYKGFIANAMENDNQTQITVDGVTFTPATANGSAQVQAAMAAVRNQFISEYGLIGTDVAVLNKYAFPNMRQAESKLGLEYSSRFAADESFALQQEAKAAFVADGDYGAFVARLQTTLDANGKPLGKRGAHAEAKKFLTEAINNDTLTTTQVEAIEGQRVPWDPKGRTFGQLYPSLVKGAIRDAYAFDRQEAKLEKERLAEAANEREMELYEEIRNNPGKYTEDDIDSFQKEYMKMFDKPSAKLDEAKRSFSATAKQKKDQQKFLSELQMTGRLMPRHLKGVHPDVAAQFNGVAIQNQQARGATGSYKDQLASIAKEVKIARGDLTGEKGANIDTQLIITELQDKFLAQVAKNIANSSSNPVAEAMVTVQQEFINQGGTNTKAVPNGRYHRDLANGRDNFKRIIQNQSTKGTDTVNEVEAKVRAVGREKAFDTPGLVFNAKQLEKMESNYGQPGWQPPALALYLGEKYNVDPFTIIDKQRAAAGLEPLDSPSAAIVEGFTPAGKELLNRFRSQNRSTRAMSSEVGAFNPELVEYGDLIQQAASQQGADPAHIAALMEIESGGDPSATSPTGAIGLMQIQPDAHPSYGGGKDPAANIAYGTQYFQQLLQQFGDPVAAAGAYNAGPGRYLEHLETGRPLPQETVQHMKKFTKALSRYNRRALNRPEARRGEFEVVQLVTTDPRADTDGDPSTVRDVAGHGGDTMHQHYEFRSQRQAKLAKALYESKGFRVTSYLRPNDNGSAHQHGYAIDVAPPLELARNDSAEMEWIDKANAVIGY